MSKGIHMTRRTLMQGAAATATLGALATPLRAFPANPDVVIIGAGAAGIAAARKLVAEGLEVAVIEAAGRTGGRAWTESETLGLPFDRGASWLQGPADAAHVRLARELNFELRDHSNPRDMLFIGDQRMDAGVRRQRDRTWSAFYSALLDARGDVAADTVVPMDAPFANVIATWMGPMDFGVDLDQLSRMDWYAFADFGANYLVREGLGTLVAMKAQSLPIRLDTAACAVDWSGDGVAVETDAGTIRARACIVTVSTGVLASGAIRFTPELPATTQSAIADLPMEQLLKIGLRFDGARFGLSPDDFVSHDIDGALPGEACYFLAFPAGLDYMVGFAGGRFGSELERAGEEAAIAFALDQLESMLGSDVRRHFQRGTMAGWEGDPLARGAYSAALPGGFGARRALAEPLGERVFFAGEAMATPYATLITGAHMHGERVAGVIAERLAAEGLAVTYVTDEDSVSAWAGNTSERWRVRAHLMKLGVEIVTAHTLTGFDGAEAALECEYSGAMQRFAARGAVLFTQRAPRDGLYHDILAQGRGDPAALPFSLQRIGDAEAPAIIAAAVHAGHRFVTELDTAVDRDEPLRHDRPIIGARAEAPAASVAPAHKVA